MFSLCLHTDSIALCAIFLVFCSNTCFFWSKSYALSRVRLPVSLDNSSTNNEQRSLKHIDGTSVLSDKVVSQLESGAKRWQQSINTSLSYLNPNWLNKAIEIAHSEPLKSDQKPSKEETATNVDYEDAVYDSGARSKPPACAKNGKHYCGYRENYPQGIVSRIVKYYKYPLESMFRDLQQQVMPTLAKDQAGGLVCDTTTQLLRVGWAMNTNGRWLVVLNTDQYQQYVTEVICRYRSNANCNFVPPCYRATCLQRYNTQKLLVIDPAVPHKGPFLSEFIFPSCCVCQIEMNKSFISEEKRKSHDRK